ncbi:MAG: peptidoglycan DD-metalloendopeptidase family protein [Acidobacteriota bacterium]|jgi:murein DD-endopeptidase MepM/ murein hydrolase activator NlpD
MLSRESATVRILRLAVPVGLVFLAIAIGATGRRLDTFGRSPFPLTASPAFRPAAAGLGLAPADRVRLSGDPLVPVETTVRRGQTLEGLLGESGLERREAVEAAGVLAEHVDPRTLRPGDTLAVYLDRDAAPARLELSVEERGRVSAVAAGGSWEGRWEPFSEVRRMRLVRGELSDSLTGAMVEAGAPMALAYAMAEVLQWDLDFTRDLRRGDRFQVLYEEVEIDGRRISIENILALTYESAIGGGRTLEAYRFAENEGYYDAEGRPLAKMFLRSPLRFSRVTSRFSRRRFHPVLKSYRPHYGVDYGAPVGTPARVTASGTVTFAGWDPGGGGRTVKVRHAKGYLTGYLHLSRIADGVRPGSRVAQGDVIGYVGSTGLATGPHLDYRVKLHGRWIDPLRIDNVKADPLDDDDLGRFLVRRDVLRASLASGEPPPGEDLLAAAGGPEPQSPAGSARAAGG